MDTAGFVWGGGRGGGLFGFFLGGLFLFFVFFLFCLLLFLNFLYNRDLE